MSPTPGPARRIVLPAGPAGSSAQPARCRSSPGQRVGHAPVVPSRPPPRPGARGYRAARPARSARPTHWAAPVIRSGLSPWKICRNPSPAWATSASGPSRTSSKCSVELLSGQAADRPGAQNAPDGEVAGDQEQRQLGLVAAWPGEPAGARGRSAPRPAGRRLVDAGDVVFGAAQDPPSPSRVAVVETVRVRAASGSVIANTTLLVPAASRAARRALLGRCRTGYDSAEMAGRDTSSKAAVVPLRVGSSQTGPSSVRRARPYWRDVFTPIEYPASTYAWSHLVSRIGVFAPAHVLARVYWGSNATCAIRRYRGLAGSAVLFALLR